MATKGININKNRESDIKKCVLPTTYTYVRPNDVFIAAVVVHLFTTFLIVLYFMMYGESRSSSVSYPQKKKKVRFNPKNSVYNISMDASRESSFMNSDSISLGEDYSSFSLNVGDSFSFISTPSPANSESSSLIYNPSDYFSSSPRSVNRNQNSWPHTSLYSCSIHSQVTGEVRQVTGEVRQVTGEVRQVTDIVRPLMDRLRKSWFQRSRWKAPCNAVGAIHCCEESGIR